MNKQARFFTIIFCLASIALTAASSRGQNSQNESARREKESIIKSANESKTPRKQDSDKDKTIGKSSEECRACQRGCVREAESKHPKPGDEKAWVDVYNDCKARNCKGRC